MSVFGNGHIWTNSSANVKNLRDVWGSLEASEVLNGKWPLGFIEAHLLETKFCWLWRNSSLDLELQI